MTEKAKEQTIEERESPFDASGLTPQQQLLNVALVGLAYSEVKRLNNGKSRDSTYAVRPDTLASVLRQLSEMVKTYFDWDAAAFALSERERDGERVVDAVLWCPNCGEQHIDEAKPDICEKCGHAEKDHHNTGNEILCEGGDCECQEMVAWLNPPHKSHRCNFCNHVWRPARRSDKRRYGTDETRRT